MCERERDNVCVCVCVCVKERHKVRERYLEGVVAVRGLAQVRGELSDADIARLLIRPALRPLPSEKAAYSNAFQLKARMRF